MKISKTKLKQMIKEELSNVFSKIYKLGYLDGTKRNFGQNADWANKNRKEPNQESHPEYWKGYDDASGGRADTDYKEFMSNYTVERARSKSKEAGKFAKSMAWPTEAKDRLTQIVKEELSLIEIEVGGAGGVNKQQFRQTIIDKVKSTGGIVPKEYNLMLNLFDLLMKAAGEGNIITGKVLKHAERLADSAKTIAPDEYAETPGGEGTLEP